MRSKGPTWITKILVTQDDIKDHLTTVLWSALPSSPECGEHMSSSQKNQNKYSAFLPSIIEFGVFLSLLHCALGGKHMGQGLGSPMNKGLQNFSFKKKKGESKKKTNTNLAN